MAKREPKPPTPEKLAIDAAIRVLNEHYQKHNFEAYAQPFGDKILISVCTPVQYPKSLRKRITVSIRKAIKPFKLSIHFVDQSKYHPSEPAART